MLSTENMCIELDQIKTERETEETETHTERKRESEKSAYFTLG